MVGIFESPFGGKTRIEHAGLKSDLRRRLACQSTLPLYDLIIDGAIAQEPVDHYYPGDDLFTPF
jgi:hypothetical protein